MLFQLGMHIMVTLPGQWELLLNLIGSSTLYMYTSSTINPLIYGLLELVFVVIIPFVILSFHSSVYACQDLEMFPIISFWTFLYLSFRYFIEMCDEYFSICFDIFQNYKYQSLFFVGKCNNGSEIIPNFLSNKAWLLVSYKLTIICFIFRVGFTMCWTQINTEVRSVQMERSMPKMSKISLTMELLVVWVVLSRRPYR